MYLLSLFRTFAGVVLGIPGLLLLAWAFWSHPVLLLISAAAIAAVWPWHKRWMAQEAAYREAMKKR